MEITDTSNSNLPKEGHYPIATLEIVKKKKIKEIYTIYDFCFSTVMDGENYGFTISLFPSQMSELLSALGAKELGRGKYEWDMEGVIGTNLSFTVAHQEDKKGTVRAVLADIKIATTSNNPDGVKKVSDIAWEE